MIKIIYRNNCKTEVVLSFKILSTEVECFGVISQPAAEIDFRNQSTYLILM